MLNIDDKEYYDRVVEFSKHIGKYDNLKDKLNYLDQYACGQMGDEDYDRSKTKCELAKDFSPASFAGTMFRRDKNDEYIYWFSFGLIFHGNHDGFGSGLAPTFAVTISPIDGWSIHT